MSNKIIEIPVNIISGEKEEVKRKNIFKNVNRNTGKKYKRIETNFCTFSEAAENTAS
ncbi:hypothetical protein [Aminipila sp.]|uniref:hypothetical protein n=1 Tax=Aminipila sp. TaxID=2060095 RepID=UPI00289C3FBA|nr:hypothetical protein [Aminipila sp.]